MIRHTVLITVKPGTSAEATEQMIAAAGQLPEHIQQIRKWEVGSGLNSGNATVGIVGLFDDLDAFSEYMSHPAHRACAQKFIVPIMESGHQVQFEV